MRLLRLPVLGFLASIAVLSAAPIACSGGTERPDAGQSGGGGGDGGPGGYLDSGDTGVPPQGEPADLTYASTICGTTPCGIMGIKKSGFQELADVSFVVKDSAGKPISGAPVKFELESPPSGTEFLGDAAADGGTGAGSSTVTIKTDKDGKATARVQSGVTLGVFTVIASVNALQAKSPAIGVRGVTPANRGFNLQCELKNLAAYTINLPPRPLKTACTVTLIDRFNNPVGKGTTINLKVEAGAIPSSVQSTPFNATGPNTDEGKASVDFSTVGAFPPVDVPAITGANGVDERSDGAGKNQRDGLVTILAYVAGEEAFDDNNSNGQWDPGENFIDQGEPFVDSNDNNQWDPGEFYADVAPSNNKYDGPNNKWDKTTTIWTSTYVLYSGFLTRSVIVPNDNPTSVPVGGSMQMKAYFADDRFNPPQLGGTTVYEFARVGTRGAAAGTVTAQLDGYSFELVRALYDASNPSVSCSASIARCQWLTKFNFEPGVLSGHSLGVTVAITGGAAPPAPELGTFLFGASSNGGKVTHTASVRFE